MITVTLNANGVRRSVLVDKDTTLSDFFSEQKLNPSVTPVYLDGAPIIGSNQSKTFAELGIEDSCIISSIVKTNNA